MIQAKVIPLLVIREIDNDNPNKKGSETNRVKTRQQRSYKRSWVYTRGPCRPTINRMESSNNRSILINKRIIPKHTQNEMGVYI